MLAACHLTTGAAIGKWTGRARIAVPLALVSHFVLDALPHVDSHGLFGAANLRPTTGEVIGAVADTFIGIGLVLWVAHRQPRRGTMLWAAFAAVVLDLANHVPPWAQLFRTWPGTSWLAVLHRSIEWNLPRHLWPFGMAAQLAVIVLAMWLIRRTNDGGKRS